jgi:hypothetical protein
MASNKLPIVIDTTCIEELSETLPEIKLPIKKKPAKSQPEKKNKETESAEEDSDKDEYDMAWLSETVEY